jgi:hypothetical protein
MVHLYLTNECFTTQEIPIKRKSTQSSDRVPLVRAEATPSTTGLIYSGAPSAEVLFIHSPTSSLSLGRLLITAGESKPDHSRVSFDTFTSCLSLECLLIVAGLPNCFSSEHLLFTAGLLVQSFNQRLFKYALVRLSK